MLTVAYVLMVLGGIVFLIGCALTIFTAFRISKGWGFCLLFGSWLILPFVLFLTKHWSSARVVFLITVAGIMVCGAGLFVLAGTETMASTDSRNRTYSSQPYRSDDRVPTAPSRRGEVPPRMPTIAPTPTAAPQPTPTPRDDRQALATPARPTIPYGELRGHIGERIELELTDGSRSIVILERVEPSGITVSRHVGGGRFSYPVRRNLIASIRKVG